MEQNDELTKHGLLFKIFDIENIIPKHIIDMQKQHQVYDNMIFKNPINEIVGKIQEQYKPFKELQKQAIEIKEYMMEMKEQYEIEKNEPTTKGEMWEQKKENERIKAEITEIKDKYLEMIDKINAISQISNPVKDEKLSRIKKGLEYSAKDKVCILKYMGLLESDMFKNIPNEKDKYKLLSKLFGGDNADNIGKYLTDARSDKTQIDLKKFLETYLADTYFIGK
jgi:hypothetical protein